MTPTTPPLQSRRARQFANKHSNLPPKTMSLQMSNSRPRFSRPLQRVVLIAEITPLLALAVLLSHPQPAKPKPGPSKALSQMRHSRPCFSRPLRRLANLTAISSTLAAAPPSVGPPTLSTENSVADSLLTPALFPASPWLGRNPRPQLSILASTARRGYQKPAVDQIFLPKPHSTVSTTCERALPTLSSPTCRGMSSRRSAGRHPALPHPKAPKPGHNNILFHTTPKQLLKSALFPPFPVPPVGRGHRAFPPAPAQQLLPISPSGSA